MKNFTSVKDVENVFDLVNLAQKLKQDPYQLETIGRRKTLGLVFLNPSLRTRLSTQKAAYNLGMDVLVMNINQDGWVLETQDGAVMNGQSQEHIKEAVGVISQYCDLLGVRTFPTLINKSADYAEKTLHQFLTYSKVPVISLESATLHPLQSLADMLTLQEQTKGVKKKVVLTWAPHPKVLPQAVANSFLQWTKAMDIQVVVSHPKGMELSPEFMDGHTLEYDQEKAMTGADFVYAKNWSSFTEYGSHLSGHTDWTITAEKMQLTNNGKFMHCLPVRRNVVVTDDVLDGTNSLVLEQANNRTYAAQAVLAKLLGHD